MTTARKIQEFLDARRLAYIHPEAYRTARRTLLACDQADVRAHFEMRLQNPDEEERAQAVAGIAVLYGTDATDTIVRSLGDESVVVRWVACGCLHDCGDGRAQAGLLDRLKHDSDPQVRGAAASALGRLGALEILPDLYVAWQTDREVDQLGHSPSSQSEDAITDLLRGWVIRQLQGSSPRVFQEATPQGQMLGRVVAEGIPFDDQGRITKTPRYAPMPVSAFGFGWSSQLDLQTNLASPFEIDVKYVDPLCVIRRVFVFHYLPDSADTNWSVQTILDASALYKDDD